MRPGNHGRAADVDDLRRGADVAAHVGVRADGDDAAVVDRERLGDREAGVDGQDLAVGQSESAAGCALASGHAVKHAITATARAAAAAIELARIIEIELPSVRSTTKPAKALIARRIILAVEAKQRERQRAEQHSRLDPAQLARLERRDRRDLHRFAAPAQHSALDVHCLDVELVRLTIRRRHPHAVARRDELAGKNTAAQVFAAARDGPIRRACGLAPA